MSRLSARGSLTWLIKLYPVWRFSNVGFQWQGGLKRVWSRIEWAQEERIQISALRTRVFVHTFISPNNITKCRTSPAEILGLLPSADFALRYANSKNLIEVSPKIVGYRPNSQHKILIKICYPHWTDYKYTRRTGRIMGAFSRVLTHCKVTYLKPV